MVLEVMGRHAGWIALHGGLAGGADIILIPEIPFDYEKISAEIARRDREGSKCTMIVVAEGAAPLSGRQTRTQTASGEHRLGGIGELVSREIGSRTDKEVRTCVLGHLQRGGAPTMLDRILGTTFGVKAVQLVAEGKFGSMVSYSNYETRDVAISDAVHKMRRVNPESQIVKMARAVEISFGD
jgi:6-phosphofructokinase 1